MKCLLFVFSLFLPASLAFALPSMSGHPAPGRQFNGAAVLETEAAADLATKVPCNLPLNNEADPLDQPSDVAEIVPKSDGETTR